MWQLTIFSNPFTSYPGARLEELLSKVDPTVTPQMNEMLSGIHFKGGGRDY
jgi:hypothetical protein